MSTLAGKWRKPTGRIEKCRRRIQTEDVPKKYEINLIVKLAARKEQRQTAPFDVSGIRRCALLLISAREHLSAFRETNTPTDCIRKTS